MPPAPPASKDQRINLNPSRSRPNSTKPDDVAPTRKRAGRDAARRNPKDRRTNVPGAAPKAGSDGVCARPHTRVGITDGGQRPIPMRARERAARRVAYRHRVLPHVAAHLHHTIKRRTRLLTRWRNLSRPKACRKNTHPHGPSIDPSVVTYEALPVALPASTVASA